MGKKVVFGIGIGMILLGLVGTYNAINSFGKAAEKSVDLTATGSVTDVYAMEMKHRIGLTLDTSYHFEFKFTAADGKEYSGEEIVDKAQIDTLAVGKPVAVKYHSNNPSINAASDYGYYVAVGDLPKSTPTFRLFFCLGFLTLGVAVVILAWKFVDDSPATPAYQA